MKVKEKLISMTGKATLVVKKHSPEILAVVGVASVIGGVAMAVKGTLSADDVLEEHKERLKKLDMVANDYPDEYTKEMKQKDLVVAYTKTGVSFAKLYIPTITLEAIGIGCLLISNNILRKRYLGAVAAFNGVSEAFKAYRKRISNDLGEDVDQHYMYGTPIDKKISVEYKDEDGKKIKKTIDLGAPDENGQLPSDIIPNASQFARFFDPSSSQWDEDPSMNLSFLTGQQNHWNNILQVRGHVFLNEVYEALGFEHSQVGALVGWVKGQGDDYIDFNIHDPNAYANRRFVNGLENVVLLDFNVDGVIYDKI